MNLTAFNSVLNRVVENQDLRNKVLARLRENTDGAHTTVYNLKGDTAAAEAESLIKQWLKAFSPADASSPTNLSLQVPAAQENPRQPQAQASSSPTPPPSATVENAGYDTFLLTDHSRALSDAMTKEKKRFGETSGEWLPESHTDLYLKWAKSQHGDDAVSRICEKNEIPKEMRQQLEWHMTDLDPLRAVDLVGNKWLGRTADSVQGPSFGKGDPLSARFTEEPLPEPTSGGLGNASSYQPESKKFCSRFSSHLAHGCEEAKGGIMTMASIIADGNIAAKSSVSLSRDKRAYYGTLDPNQRTSEGPAKHGPYYVVLNQEVNSRDLPRGIPADLHTAYAVPTSEHKKQLEFFLEDAVASQVMSKEAADAARQKVHTYDEIMNDPSLMGE